MAQTSVQESRSIRFGSAVLEVGPSVDALVNFGALRNVVFGESFTKVQIRSDNADIIAERIKEHACQVTADLMEISIKNLSMMRGTLDDVQTIPGVETPITDESLALRGLVPAVLGKRNASGAVATAISVGDGDTTTYTEGTDYVVGLTPGGDTTISRVDGSTIPDGQTVAVAYTVTPAAATVMKTGGKYALSTNVVRLTNFDEEGRRFMVTVFKASAGTGINLPFAADDADDPMLTSIQLDGTPDTQRARGEQLFEIYDEQGAA